MATLRALAAVRWMVLAGLMLKVDPALPAPGACSTAFVDVVPANVSLQTSFTFPRPIQADLETIRRARTIRDLIPRRNTPVVTTTPSSFPIQWLVACNVAGGVALESPIGEFRSGSEVLATSSTFLSVPGASCAPAPGIANEMVTLPSAITDRVLNALLDLPVPERFQELAPETLTQAIQQLAARQRFEFGYRRSFARPIIACVPEADTLTLSVNSRLNAQIAFSFCRLANVSVTPPPQTIVLDPRASAATLPFTWTTTNQCIGANPAPINVSSSQYVIKNAAGAPLQSVSNVISRPGLTFGTAIFTETLTIPPSAFLAAADSGSNGVVVERTFTDGVVSRTASARVFFGTASGAPFSITRLALRYDDGSRVKIIPENGQLRLIADINFNGAGLLQAQWEVAGPTAPGGVPFFRPMQLVRQYLVGSQYVSLTSPLLPSGVDGMYFVRLAIQDPTGLTEVPLLRYFVGEYTEETAVALRRDLPETIRALAPGAGVAAEPGLRFAWTPVERAATYQVEIYRLEALDDKFVPSDQPEIHSSLVVRGRPATGMAVPSDQTSAEMSQLVRDYLQPGSYWWRVVANDKDGAVIAAGPLRRIAVP